MAQAGTLMHELGHNLGLRHGGDDHVRYKPNYLSVMNYAFQLTGLLQADLTARLDYSRFAIGMNEAALNETTGFGVPAGAPAAAFITLGRCPSGAQTSWPLLAQPSTSTATATRPTSSPPTRTATPLLARSRATWTGPA